MEPEKKGKTLWEMFTERLQGSGNGSGMAFYNPLDLRVHSAVNVPFSNGPELSNFEFEVQEIREVNRQIGGKEYRFTDYVLRGVNKKTFDANDVITARIRAVPNQAGAYDALFLRVYDEFAFAEDFLGVVKDDTGIFETTDEKAGTTETFSRINDVKGSYEAAVLVVSETTPDGKAAPGKTSATKLEYWDYWRDQDIGSGNTAKEFVFVEMNTDTGWFQIWRGREFFS